MTRRNSRGAALAAALTLVAFGSRIGLAQVPTPANSITPRMIPVVGHDASGVPDPIGEVTVIFRDLANQPIAGALIQLDFSACTELRLCADSHDPSAVTDCAQRTITKVSDANGAARFRVVGYSVAPPGTPGAPYNAARVYADGVLLASPSVAIYDLTGGGGLTPADLSAWLDDFFGGFDPARSDYDDTGAPLGPSDLARWLTAFFASGSIQNCTPGSGSCAP